MPIAYPLEDAIAYLHEHGADHLTVRQLSILLALREGDQTVRGMAEQLKVHRPAITRNVDKFVDRGWVKRRDDPEDGRSVLMALTAEGRKFMTHFC